MTPNAIWPAPYEPDEAAALLAHLRAEYDGVFSEEVARNHLVNHVGFAFAEYALAVSTPRLADGARILDIGAGFGSYVLGARLAGYDAVGVEPAPTEAAFARSRLLRVRPQDNPEHVYLLGDAASASLTEASFDAVTLWNVLEHTPDGGAMLACADRALKAGGWLFAICPNYDAVRDEAHYGVPWKPELSRDRAKAAAYLRSLGRNPRFFETSIFCRTQREVLGWLDARGYALHTLDYKPMSLWRGGLSALKDWSAYRAFRDPARPSVEVAARKRA